MARAKLRPSGRYSAFYIPAKGGREVSAGTYETHEKAMEVAERMELWSRTGTTGLSPAEKATLTIAEYAERWLVNHAVERSTRDTYRSVLYKHIIPKFGHVRVADIQREQIRAYFSELKTTRAAGRRTYLSASSIRSVRACLSAMLHTAMDDGYRSDNPAHRVKVAKGSRKKITVMTQEQFGTVYNALPTEGARVLSDLIVSTGCRVGEAVVLRVSDIDTKNQKVWFQRALQDVAKRHNGGKRFFVEDTKTHNIRDVSLDDAIQERLIEWCQINGLKGDDYIFPRSLVLPLKRDRRIRIELTPDVLDELEWFLGPNGQEYRHGTMNGYVTGKCKCDYCKQGFADYRYKHDKERAGNITEQKRIYREDDFVNDDIWRVAWVTACKSTDLGWTPTAYQLRHTHASWLIDAGVDAVEVKNRLGHASLATTDLYVHHVDGRSGRKGANAMSAMRSW